MRAVTLLKDAMNGHIKQDIHRLIGRQEAFNDEDCGKRKINCWEIKELDFASAKTEHSLRDYIMGIMQVDNDRPLFHSVDHMHFNRSTVVFTCMPAVELEARNMVVGLLTFLKRHYQDEVTAMCSQIILGQGRTVCTEQRRHSRFRFAVELGR
jgi:hypothetical protein